MSHVEYIRFSVQAARSNSLSEAARRLDVSPAAANAALKRLEAELGLRLMVRSTRNLRLMQAGEVFLAQCAQGLQLIQQAREQLQPDHSSVAGVLQISLLPSLNEWLPANHLTRFVVEVIEQLDLSALTSQYGGCSSAASPDSAATSRRYGWR